MSVPQVNVFGLVSRTNADNATVLAVRQNVSIFVNTHISISVYNIPKDGELSSMN